MASAKSPNGGTGLHSGREKLQQAYHLAGEAAQDTAEHMKTRARETAGHMKTRTRESMEKGKQRAHDVAERAESSIKAHPLVSVGCAFAAGWLIAKIFK
ncbi:DUF883 family protein [Microbulbifer harenosus]|uniref:DUF883 family protein n=1 Tax=Microbulbifer harenosus TaxID=2576840 RepID=A0ABY2ULE2_9GAMM|nr:MULTISPECIES: DUF883 family protein [Microbulbifer]QIL91596.1 DUF883 family protein [Microbulbifer sp. SH-1]TLM76583.1 DUF883 family protein [Microbulbifer harenosus]